MNAIAVALHVLAAVIWVGGMFFAYLALRPAIAGNDALVAGQLWVSVFRRFFPWVWACIVVLLASGLLMIFTAFGGFRHAPMFVNVMMALGLVMMLLFAFVWFRIYPRLQQAVQADDETAIGTALRHISRIFLINLVLGLIVIFIAMSGSFSFYD